jgi:hypothetical protein
MVETKKWQDPEYKKNYNREYYLKTRQLKNTEKVFVDGWTKDPELKKEYFKKYHVEKRKQEFECEVCKCTITYAKKSYHQKSKVHLNALRLRQLGEI